MRELTEAELDIVSGGTEPEGGDEVRRLETVTVRPDDRNGGGGSGGTLRLPTVVVTGTSGGSGSASFGGSGFPSFPSSWFGPDGPALPEADLPSAGDLVPPTPNIAEATENAEAPEKEDDDDNQNQRCADLQTEFDREMRIMADEKATFQFDGFAEPGAKWAEFGMTADNMLRGAEIVLHDADEAGCSIDQSSVPY